MISLHQQRKKQALAVLLIIVTIVTLLYLLWIQPTLHRMQQNQATIEQLHLQMEKIAQAEQKISQLDQTAVTIEQEPSHDEWLLANNIPNLAAAKLQNRLKGLINNHDGNLIRIDTDVESSEDIYTSIIASMTFKSDIKGLYRILYQLKISRPMLFVTSLQLYPDNFRSNLAEDIEIETDLVITAYINQDDTQPAIDQDAIEN